MSKTKEGREYIGRPTGAVLRASDLIAREEEMSKRMAGIGDRARVKLIAMMKERDKYND